MANKKIAGITVEIGGDTTKLSKALTDVDKKSRDLKSELKDLDKALKLDPKNTELLAQKQQVLAEAIKNSKEKLDKLKEAEKQIEQQFKSGQIDNGQYRAFKREVESTKEELGYYEKQAQEAKTQTDKLNSSVKASKDDFKSAGESIEKAGEKVTAFGDGLTKAGEKATAASAVIAAAAAASYKAWEETDEGYDTIVKKTGATGEALEELKTVADSVYTSLPVGMGKVGTAIGEINTRFGSTGDQLEDLTTKFIKYSEINDSDVNTSIDNISGAMKAFGLDASSAGAVLDKLTSIGQRTGLSVSQLESSLLSNADNFKALGYSISDAAELLGQFEINGVDSSTALTSMKKTISSLIKEEQSASQSQSKAAEAYDKAQTQYKKTSAALEVLKQKQKEYTSETKESTKLADSKKIELYEAELEKLETTMANLKSRSEGGFYITDFGGEFDKYIEDIKNAENEVDAIELAAELFGSKGAASMAAAIREGRADFTKFNSTLEDTAGAVDNTFEATLDAPDKLKVAMNQVKLEASDLAALAMEKLAPALKKVTDKIKELTKKFNSLSDSEKTTILKITGIVAAIGPLLILLGKITSSVGGIISVVGKLFSMVAANPVVLAIAAIVAALAVLYIKNEKFRNFVNDTAKDIAEFFQEIARECKQWYEDNKPLIDDMIQVLKFLGEILMNYLMTAITDTVNGFKLAWTMIKTTWKVSTAWFKYIWDTIKGIFSVVKKVLSGDFQGAWDSIKEIFSPSRVGEFFGEAFDAIKGAFTGIGQWFYEKFNGAWNRITGVFNVAGKYFGNVFTEIGNAFEKIPDKIGGFFTSAFDRIKTALKDLIEWVDDELEDIPFAGEVYKGAKKAIGAVADKIPFLAQGGTLTHNGDTAVVGEAGPELLRLLNGKAVVTPLNNNSSQTDTPQSAQAATQRTTVHQTYNIYVKEFATAQDARKTSQELAQLQRQTDYGKGLITV